MARYNKNENIIVRKVLPSYFLVDITKCYNNTEEKMFITDEIGYEIWNTIQNGDTYESIYNKFLNKLTDEKTDDLKKCVNDDLQEFMNRLLEQDCLYEVI